VLAKEIEGSVVPAERVASLASAHGVTVPDLMGLLVPLAAEQYSTAPISGFRVGAVARGSSGALYLGANLELAGTALETVGGAVYSGRYAENAAFNPSLAPLACALTMRVLGGGAEDAVTRAVLVEAPSQVSHAGATAEALRAVSAAALEVFQAAG